MRMRPRPFVVPKSGDPFANDTLGRKDQIEELTVLLRNIEGPCVLALDAPWGAGKTVFLQMWAQHLKRARFRVAEFNAWETDFSDDPLIALYAALENVLYRSSATKAKNALKAGAIMVSKLASTTLPVPDIAALVAAAGDRPEDSTEMRLSRHRDAERAIGDFKRALKQATRDRLPLVVFIDELDRCRPDYAISLLESTKHLFDVDGVIFILGVNLDELAHSVKATYGGSFSSDSYLDRFLDRRISLPKPDRQRFLEDLFNSVGLAGQLNSNNFIRWFLDYYLLGAPHISLRDIEQSVMHLGTVITSLQGTRSWSGRSLDMIAATLLLIRAIVPKTHARFIRGEITDLQTLEEFNSAINRPSEWWRGRNYDQTSRVGARFEAVLAGWGSAIGAAHDRESSLLQKRHHDADQDDDGYPATVIHDAVEVARQIETRHFLRVLSLIEMTAYIPVSSR